MATMTYKEQLLHPNWQRKRLEALAAAEWECTNCGDKQTTLHVHHKRYVKGRMAWEYSLDELAVLCADCHANDHAARDLLERLLLEADLGAFGNLSALIGLFAGYADGSVAISPELASECRDLDGYSYLLGVLASIASGAAAKETLAAVEVLSGGASLSPAQDQAVALWRSWSQGA